MKISTLNPVMILSLLTLAGCGGGGGYGGGKSPGGGTTPPESPPPTFTISVAVTGLDGEVVLQNNAADDLSVKANGTVPFTKQLNANATYEVTIKTLPAHQHCELTNAKGTVGTSNVTVAVACASNPVNSHTLSVSVTGLTGTLKLHDKSGANLTVTGNGLSSFLPPFQGGFEYAITITDQPAGQQCTLGSNSSGTVGDTDNIDAVIVGVTCDDVTTPSSHLVSANVTGLLANTSVVLQNNGSDDLTVPGNAVVPFSQPVQAGGGYNVSVKTQPAGATCQIPAGAGTIGADDVVVDVACQANAPGTHSLSVTVSGLTSNSVVVRNNADPEVTLTASSNNFTFGTFVSGAPYAVTIVTQPSSPPADCAFTDNPTGTIGDADVVLKLECTTLPTTTLTAQVSVFRPRSVLLNWLGVSVPQPTYNLYVSTRADCDFRTCGEKLTNVPPGQQINGFNGQPLKNGQLYFFQLESTFASTGSRTAKLLSNKIAARPNTVAFDGAVNAITTAPDGTAYLGGSFHSVGVSSGSLLALDRVAGDVTGGLAAVQVPAVAGAVNAILADGAGGWYLGGEFTHVGNVVRNNLAHVNADGSVDPAFDHATDGPVLALSLIDSTLYVGGKFDAIAPAAAGNSPRNAAAINLIDGSLVSWNPNPNDEVRAIARLAGAVYLGGHFTNLHPRLAGFDIDGAGLPQSATPTTIDFQVNDAVEVLTARDDSLYIGGSFTSIGGTSRLAVARADLDGGTPKISNAFHPDPTIDPNIFGPVVYTIVVSDDASLVWIGGAFDALQGNIRRESRLNLAAVAASTGAPTPWSPNPNGPVYTLAAQGNTIYAGGGFLNVGLSRTLRRHLAAINLSNGDILDLNPGVHEANAAPRPVRALVVAGNALYMGGSFTHLDAGGAGREHLASLNPQGALQPWSPAANGDVNTVLFHNNGFLGPVVYAGGLFTQINGNSHVLLAALNANTGDDNFGTFEGIVNGRAVRAIAALDSSGLYVGGDFDSIGAPSIRSPNVAKLFFHNGTINAGFQPNASGPVNALIATNDIFTGSDVVYLGGAFGDARGASHLAKVDADSGLPIRTGAGQLQLRGTDGDVNTLALEPDGTEIYAGGAFNNFLQPNGQKPTPGGLVQVGTGNGASGGAFDPQPDAGPGGAGRPRALLPLEVNTLLAGGAFIGIGGQPIANFAALDHGFTRGSALRNVVFPTGPVNAIAVAGNNIYVGGRFSGVNAPVNGSSSAGVCGNFAVINSTTGALVE